VVERGPEKAGVGGSIPSLATTFHAYDAASELTSIVYQGGNLAPSDLEYSYDLAGRRVGVSGSLASTQLPAAVASAAYNADNQLTQWGSATLTYDLNGNTLYDGTNTYSWDARNRLVSMDNNGATFAYDALGRRVSKTIQSANTSFLYDGVNPVQELNGTTPTANLLTGGIDERFTRTDANGTLNYLTDALGSTIALTDPSGNTQAQYSYDPYGNMNATGSTTNSYTYTGREFDGLGLYYYRARYYNPNTARFISEDPIGFLGGINKFAYVDGDPVDFIDPFGADKRGGCPQTQPQLTAGPNQPDPDIPKSLQELGEVDDQVEFAITNRAIIPAAMVTTGLIVAATGTVATIALCSSGVGCLLSPVTALTAAGGLGLAGEGVYYFFHQDIYNPFDQSNNPSHQPGCAQ
jgi:RHS repeat-associated protein